MKKKNKVATLGVKELLELEEWARKRKIPKVLYPDGHYYYEWPVGEPVLRVRSQKDNAISQKEVDEQKSL